MAEETSQLSFCITFNGKLDKELSSLQIRIA
jgi:hypothetical protein